MCLARGIFFSFQFSRGDGIWRHACTLINCQTGERDKSLFKTAFNKSDPWEIGWYLLSSRDKWVSSDQRKFFVTRIRRPSLVSMFVNIYRKMGQSFLRKISTRNEDILSSNSFNLIIAKTKKKTRNNWKHYQNFLLYFFLYIFFSKFASSTKLTFRIPNSSSRIIFLKF